MDDIANVRSNDGIVKHAANMGEAVDAGDSAAQGRAGEAEVPRKRRRPWGKKQKSYSHVHYKVYKRRWFGLAQLVLLNVVVSWDVSTNILFIYLKF